jgi:hypothetical protein
MRRARLGVVAAASQDAARRESFGAPGHSEAFGNADSTRWEENEPRTDPAIDE